MKVIEHENAHCTFGSVLVYGGSSFQQDSFREID
jgi:hypothetical protein